MGNTSIYKSTDGANAVETKYNELLRLWPIEKQQLELQTRHGRTRVIICGNPQNPPLLLFHPANCNSVYWLKQVQTYTRSHRVFAVDLIGEAGGSELNRPPHKGASYAEWIEDVFRELELDRAALLGVSLGAWMCLKFACAWPERVERLALISPLGIIPARRARSRTARVGSALLGSFGRRLVFRSQLRKGDMDPKLRELMELTERNLKPRAKQLPRFSDKELNQLYCPILLMAGGKDAYLNMDRLILRAAKAMPQVEIHFRLKDGHYPGEFAREVDRFLATHYAPD